MGEKRERQSQAMLRAVNRDVRALPRERQSGALVELARELARRFDGGDLKVAGELRRTLAELQRPGRAGPRAGKDEPAAAEEVPERDLVDDITADRAARRDELARRRARRAGAADHDGTGARPGAAADGG